MSIDTIMTGIEALAPTYDSDITVRVWGYDAIKDTLNEATCPVRMILAPADGADAGAEVITHGVAKTTWSIVDRLYLMPVNLDTGIQAYNHKWFLYIESYSAAVKANRCLSTTNATVTGVQFSKLEPKSYPEGSAGAYWTIDAILTVEEFV